jgi:SPX domain protein involved in polyphosphate accumulation
VTQPLQANRFEFKYIIEEQRARGIRDFLRGHLEVDEYAQDRPDASYVIHSLYLDSPTLVLYRQTAQGLKNRIKLRIRFYDDVPEHPAFLEIKRRVSDAVLKERAAITRAGAQQLLCGRSLAASQLIASPGNRDTDGARERFCGLCEKLDAQPAAYISYVREAYVSPASSQLRVTLDRQVYASPFDDRVGLAPPAGGIAADPGGIVLEIKFIDRFPSWMRELVWSFNLQRRAASKYVRGVEALGLRPGRWLHVLGCHGPDAGDRLGPFAARYQDGVHGRRAGEVVP